MNRFDFIGSKVKNFTEPSWHGWYEGQKFKFITTPDYIGELKLSGSQWWLRMQNGGACSIVPEHHRDKEVFLKSWEPLHE